jgi:undecaprenyl-diphosphatase
MATSCPTRLTRALLGLAVALPGPALTARGEEPGLPRVSDRQHFTIDPVVDGVLVAGGATFDLFLGLVLSTGEIRPQAPGNPDVLLSIDRVAVTQTIDPHAATASNIGLWTAYGFALLDPVLSGVRDGRRALLVDGIMYAESLAITAAFTQVTKIAVRRPRPLDYARCSDSGAAASTACSSTDLQLSFFSGHASATAAISATASYLAFARRGWRSPRPWITLGAGTLLTAFVSTERVRAGYHFPTDVIMGSLAGAGIGVLVPHLHRRPHYHEQELESPPLIIGYTPSPGGGGSMTVAWRF